jgi:hypothetical protein
MTLSAPNFIAGKQFVYEILQPIQTDRLNLIFFCFHPGVAIRFAALTTVAIQISRIHANAEMCFYQIISGCCFCAVFNAPLNGPEFFSAWHRICRLDPFLPDQCPLQNHRAEGR